MRAWLNACMRVGLNACMRVGLNACMRVGLNTCMRVGLNTCMRVGLNACMREACMRVGVAHNNYGPLPQNFDSEVAVVRLESLIRDH
jgi:hypothetical protein